MNTNGKKIKTRESNRIVYESLENISESFFEQVYKQADRTLAKIIKKNTKVDQDDKNSQTESNKGSSMGVDKHSINVISFLAGRGRGKTSAMLSFLSHLTKLQAEKEWSEIEQIDDKKFLVLPYIDAAMLAEAEYIIDVVLAEMWDNFEDYTKRKYNLHDAKFEKMERDIKQKFIDVRKAYLVLKEREEGKATVGEMDVPVPSALHELAVSVNLRAELRKLIDYYLEIFQYNSDAKTQECYLVIAIDDVDMSGSKAHFILEQIRRFLCMQKVIIFITADIDRLQLACEVRYSQIYMDDSDRRKFINEYLEKVLPYNMRIYLPEIKERHDMIIVDTPAKDELKLNSRDEKGMILEFMARDGGIYFDNYRRKRHFLQNQTMRSMVNYFEQMIRMKDDCITWMKTDLKERIAERISDANQKRCMNELFSKDYEDVNDYLISYMINEKNDDYADKSLGQVLYTCRSFEDKDSRNIEFINAIIMFYSFTLKQCDDDMKQKIIGESLWGAQEYGLVTYDGRTSADCVSFHITGRLNLRVNEVYEGTLLVEDVKSAFEKIVKENHTSILSWLCSMLFVTPDMSQGNDFVVAVYMIENTEDDDFDAGLDVEYYEIESADEDHIEEEWNVILQPEFSARKNYLTNAFRTYEITRECCHRLLSGALNALAQWIVSLPNSTLGSDETYSFVDAKADEIIDEIFDKKSDRVKKRIHECEIGSITNGLEILYSIGKVVPYMKEKSITNEADAYNRLVSSYDIIQNELGRRDKYFKELDINTKFQEEFLNSAQAKMLLDSKWLPDVKEDFARRMGSLLYEFRGGAPTPTTSVSKKTN